MRCVFLIFSMVFGVALPQSGALLAQSAAATTRPVAREMNLPRTRWENQPGSERWTRSTLAALESHGAALPMSVPEDISAWCPAYPEAEPGQRRAFWVGFLSALSKYESTYKPTAVGGGGRWFGLVQIQPSTARGYGCYARSGAELKNGSANLSCAVRIMAVTVPRDGVIATKDGSWKGVAADWGPVRSASKRSEMQSWLSQQTYCRPLASVRPRPRPERR